MKHSGYHSDDISVVSDLGNFLEVHILRCVYAFLECVSKIRQVMVNRVIHHRLIVYVMRVSSKLKFDKNVIDGNASLKYHMIVTEGSDS
jgi:hypothetical protein